MTTSFGTGQRLSIGLRTILGSLLAVGAAVLAIDLADWRYFRADLSQSGRNSLDAEVMDLVEQLPEPVVVDIFPRSLLPPYDAISNEVTYRFHEILRVAMESRRDKFEVRLHDLNDIEATQARQRELGVEGVNFVLFTNESGTRRTRQELFGDVAVVDWGNPTRDSARYLAGEGIRGAVGTGWRPDQPFRGPRLSSFRGEEVLATSLLKVSSAESPRAYFTTGQGEPSLEGEEPGELAGLRRVLEEDGFEVATWNPNDTPGVPGDCAVLAAIGATQPFPQGALQAMREWTGNGGRLIAAPAVSSLESGLRGGVAELLTSYGMIPQAGVVCQPLRGAGGQQYDGDARCAVLSINDVGLDASHPITQPLRERARRIDFVLSPSFQKETRLLWEGKFGILIPIVTLADAWLDPPLAPGQYNFRRDRGERLERQRLVMFGELPSGAPLPNGEVQKGRVLGLPSAGFLSNALIGTNKDFLLNTFNYMDEERHYRIRVAPLPRPESRLDLARSTSLATLSWSLYLGLPGACIAMGIFLAYRRRS